MPQPHSENDLRTLLEDLLDQPIDGPANSIPLEIPGFEIGEFLGEGGSSIVFKARQTSTGQMVAIKFLRADLVHRQNADRMKRECAALVRLDDRSFPRIVDSGEMRGIGFIVQEFVDGHSLTTFAEKEGLDTTQRLRLLMRVAQCVGMAHQHGIIHRDLKPGNILIRPDGSPVIVDFGLSSGDGAGFTMQLTTQGSIMGTPAYMAPEQAQGLAETSPATDVFSLGLIALQLLTGNAPQKDRPTPTSGTAGRSEAIDIPRLNNISRPKALRAILRKALQIEAKNRYPDANALADDLKRHIEGTPVSAPSIFATRMRHYWPMAASITLLVVILIVIALALRPPPFLDFATTFSVDSSETVLDDMIDLVRPEREDFPSDNEPNGVTTDLEGDQEMELKSKIAPSVIGSLLMVATSWAWQPCEVVNLAPSSGNPNDIYSDGIALNDRYIVVGAWGDDDVASDAGAVYIYDALTGDELHKIIAEDGGTFHGFGKSVALVDETVLIGANLVGWYTDRAYLYNARTGEHIRTILPDDLGGQDNFGGAAVLTQSYAVVSSSENDEAGDNAGAVYIFDVETGTQLHKLMANDAQAGDRFGAQLAIDGNSVLVASARRNDEFGKAYLFDLTTGIQIATFEATGGQGDTGDLLAIHLSSTHIILGTPQNDEMGVDTGKAFVLDRESGAILHELVAPIIEETAMFGWSVRIAGDLIIISELRGNQIKGTIHAYQLASGEYLWSATASDGQERDAFGFSLAVTPSFPDTLMVGAWAYGSGRSGSAYLLDLDCQQSLFSIAPMPLVSGERGTFTIEGALANEQTWLVYSVTGIGSTFIPALNVIVDLENPQLAAGPRESDENGAVEWSSIMPAVQHARPIWFQAVQYQNVTNYVETEIVP